MISKDEEFIKKVSAMAQKGKEKLNDLYEDYSENSEEELTDKILRAALQAKEEIEKKIEETVAVVYEKMRIAHTDELKKLELQLNAVKTELALAEARIVNLENGKS